MNSSQLPGCRPAMALTVLTATLFWLALQPGEGRPVASAAEPTGELVIRVEADGDKITQFEFMLNGQFQDSRFTTEGSPLVWELAPASYSVAENLPAGWTLEEVTCAVAGEDEHSYEIGVHVIANYKVVSGVEIQAGETTECTFRNVHGGGRITVQKIVAGAEMDQTSFQFSLTSPRFIRGAHFSESDGPQTFEVPLDDYSVRERLDLDYRPPGYRHLGHAIIEGDAPCPDAPQSTGSAATAFIDEDGEHLKVCFYNERQRQYVLFVPLVAKSITTVPGVDLSLELVSWEPVAGADGWSDYLIRITNTGSVSIDMANLTMQSWYSADAQLGGDDDCGAAGHRLQAHDLAPGQSVTSAFGANLEPSRYWPQCADRQNGYVLVAINTQAPLAPETWWLSYPVAR